ncbi:MAG: AraC family transcriptional regulator [Hyphomicrobiales bacterium]|nr:AraC family transcriptional regulator [Hyphomicrobiales bacterium]
MPDVNHFQAPTRTLLKTALPGFDAKLSESRSRGDTLFEHEHAVHRLFITIAGRTTATIAEQDGRVIRRPDAAGAVTIVPAGVRRRVLLRDLDIVVLDMHVSPDFLAACVDAGPRQSTISPPAVQNVRSDWMLRAACALCDAMRTSAPAMHAQTLAAAMLRYACRADEKLKTARGLDPTALKRVVDLMQDRIGDDLTLDDLAQASGLGVSAFSRGFRTAVGKTPYRYFMEARMRRSRELLATTSASIADVAAAVGYSDQAHFTAAFTRETGAPPGKWRQK